VSESFKAVNKLNSLEQVLVACVSNLLCGPAEAQAITDIIDITDQEFRNNTVQAIENLSTSVPGTTVTGPILATITDVATGAIVGIISSKE
jgi:hypothetical protein